METPKNIQISSKFLIEVFVLLIKLDDIDLDDDTRALCKSIEAQAQAKIDAINRRTSFTRYKTAETAEDREQYRREYLDKAGIMPGFRTDTEISYKTENAKKI